MTSIAVKWLEIHYYFVRLATLSLRSFCLLYAFKMPVNFNDENEVNEYLENLGIEYRFGCFSEKNPEVCQLLGEYLEVIKKDLPKAARIYKSNCDDDNYPKSCHSYANCVFHGHGVEKKNEVAYDYYAKACSLGIGSSCFNAGMMTLKPLSGQKHERDYMKGIELLDKGCTLNNVHACYFLSGLFITGSKDENQTIEKDLKKAFKYTEKACNLDHLYACMNLNLMYKRGEGVEKNEEMAEKINKKVEDLNQQMKSRVTIEFQRSKDSI